jgi:5-methylcytosine-specific restriction endonuclease McrA
MRTIGYPRDRDRLRMHVYERDSYRCQHCGQQGGPQEAVELHVRRIVPESRGGTGHPRNLLTLCGRCRDRISDHHILGSEDRVTQRPEERSQTTERSSEWSPGTGSRFVLLFLGGVVVPFSLTLLVMASNAGFP